MKFGELKSIAHNISDSLASGDGLLIGVFEMDVFGEAARAPEGFVDVDFLTGRTSARTAPAQTRWRRWLANLKAWASGGSPSPDLAKAIALYAKALPELCAKHGATSAAFRQLSTRYYASSVFEVTIEDQRGRRSVDTYAGRPGRRALTLDALGRVRPIPAVQTRADERSGGADG